MTWLFTQVWLWSLAAFVLGSILTWLLFVPPLRRRVRAAEAWAPLSPVAEDEESPSEVRAYADPYGTEGPALESPRPSQRRPRDVGSGQERPDWETDIGLVFNCGAETTSVDQTARIEPVTLAEPETQDVGYDATPGGETGELYRARSAEKHHEDRAFPRETPVPAPPTAPAEPDLADTELVQTQFAPTQFAETQFAQTELSEPETPDTRSRSDDFDGHSGWFQKADMGSYPDPPEWSGTLEVPAVRGLDDAFPNEDSRSGAARSEDSRLSGELHTLFEPLAATGTARNPPPRAKGRAEPSEGELPSAASEVTQNIPRVGTDAPASSEPKPQLPRRTPGASAMGRQRSSTDYSSAVAHADSAQEAVIKGHFASRQYHTPDSPRYDQIVAETWFRSEAEAEAAGFEPWNRAGST